MYPEFGHFGFKCFFAFCALTAFKISNEHLDQRRDINNTLRHIAHILDKKQSKI
jgi:hypothetical protein